MHILWIIESLLSYVKLKIFELSCMIRLPLLASSVHLLSCALTTPLEASEGR